jgi:hypothetical protein
MPFQDIAFDEDGSLVKPCSFAIHVTYTCPLTCAHCCFSSSPTTRDQLSTATIIETINSLDESTIQLVAFTGGEPFLLGDRLVAAVRTANGRGFKTRIVTSAFFATTVEGADRRLIPMRDAGLDELSISWDDFHEEFVEFECVKNAFWSAKRLGISVAVSIVQGATSRWDKARVQNELGLAATSNDVIAESPLNLTGRAEEKLSNAGLRPVRSVGPCPYVLTGPTLSAKNKLLACCGVIPETDELVIDDDYRPENLQESIDMSLRSPLLNWLHLRGPYAIAQWISNRYNISIPGLEAVGGNCQACKILFETPEISKVLHAAVAEKRNEIFGELQVLDAIGFLTPQSIMRLWNDGSTIVDSTPLPAVSSLDQK